MLNSNVDIAFEDDLECLRLAPHHKTAVKVLAVFGIVDIDEEDVRREARPQNDIHRGDRQALPLGLGAAQPRGQPIMDRCCVELDRHCCSSPANMFSHDDAEPIP